MSHINCVVCLQKSAQIPPEYFQFSNDNSFPFCSHCRVYLAKFAGLNDRLDSLAGDLTGLHEKQTLRFRKISSLQRQTLENYSDSQYKLGNSGNDQQKDEENDEIGLTTTEILQPNVSGTARGEIVDNAETCELIAIVKVIEPVDGNTPMASNFNELQPNDQALSDNEDENDKIASSVPEPITGGKDVITLKDQMEVSKTANRKKLNKTVEQVSEKDFVYKGKYQFKRTDSGFKCGSCPATSKFCEAKGSVVWNYIIDHIRRWHLDIDAKKTARQKCIEAVEQASEKKFIYKGKFPFQRVDVGFKCGSCPATSKICKLKGLTLWHFVVTHIEKWHVDSGRVRKQKLQQRFIEIAPNRFQYGSYLIEKDDNKFRCVTCGYLATISTGTKKFQYISQHINVKHENLGKKMCELCGMQFSGCGALKLHKTTQHDESNSSYPCSSCEKTFKTQIQAQVHERGVHGERCHNYVCETCGKKLISKADLQGNIALVHHGQKVFKCSDCGKAYGNFRSLIVHRNSHTGQRKYACGVCGMSFMQSYSVKRHKMTAHKDCCKLD